MNDFTVERFAILSLLYKNTINDWHWQEKNTFYLLCMTESIEFRILLLTEAVSFLTC